MKTAWKRMWAAMAAVLAEALIVLGAMGLTWYYLHAKYGPSTRIHGYSVSRMWGVPDVFLVLEDEDGDGLQDRWSYSADVSAWGKFYWSAEVDKDGRLDLVAGSYQSPFGLRFVYRASDTNGDGKIDRQTVRMPAGEKGVTVYYSDLDGDGDFDFMSYPSTGQRYIIWSGKWLEAEVADGLGFHNTADRPHIITIDGEQVKVIFENGEWRIPAVANQL